MKKTIIIDTYIEIDCCSLDTAIENLQRLQKEYGAKFTNLKLSYEYTHDSNNKYLMLKGDRDETPEEEAMRLADELRYKESRRIAYEKLKKEFER